MTRLMCPPTHYSAALVNNVWMTDLAPDARTIDRDKANRQFDALYSFIAARERVLLLPPHRLLQDQVFTANVGAYLPEQKVCLIANFALTPNRQPESFFASRLLYDFGYTPVRCPFAWEGEAEMKRLKPGRYVGGYGIRSQPEAYRWMRDRWGLDIDWVEQTNPRLYHLDCAVFPISTNDHRPVALVCTSAFAPSDVRAFEASTEIIDVSMDDALYGMCNSIRVGDSVLMASHISELTVQQPDEFKIEMKKLDTMGKICSKLGLSFHYFNLSEYLKGGAMLSCMVMGLESS